ncbi:hypothetical protein EON68_00975 [archaeon]|nr:MAG: hypothetical protein EON68_00975 [archaeon]
MSDVIPLDTRAFRLERSGLMVPTSGDMKDIAHVRGAEATAYVASLRIALADRLKSTRRASRARDSIVSVESELDSRGRHRGGFDDDASARVHGEGGALFSDGETESDFDEADALTDDRVRGGVRAEMDDDDLVGSRAWSSPRQLFDALDAPHAPAASYHAAPTRRYYSTSTACGSGGGGSGGGGGPTRAATVLDLDDEAGTPITVAPMRTRVPSALRTRAATGGSGRVSQHRAHESSALGGALAGSDSEAEVSDGSGSDGEAPTSQRSAGAPQAQRKGKGGSQVSTPHVAAAALRQAALTRVALRGSDLGASSGSDSEAEADADARSRAQSRARPPVQSPSHVRQVAVHARVEAKSGEVSPHPPPFAEAVPDLQLPAHVRLSPVLTEGLSPAQVTRAVAYGVMLRLDAHTVHALNECIHVVCDLPFVPPRPVAAADRKGLSSKQLDRSDAAVYLIEELILRVRDVALQGAALYMDTTQLSKKEVVVTTVACLEAHLSPAALQRLLDWYALRASAIRSTCKRTGGFVFMRGVLRDLASHVAFLGSSDVRGDQSGHALHASLPAVAPESSPFPRDV